MVKQKQYGQKKLNTFDCHAIIITMNTKQCSKCRKIKEVSQFSYDKSKHDGMYSSCKGCVRITQGFKPRNKKTEKTCRYCGIHFFPRPYQVRTHKGEDYFCSRDHFYKHGKSNRKSLYTGGYRKRILARDNNRCVICGIEENLHVHHIKTRGSGGKDEYSNLITICVLHHREAHGVNMTMYKKLFFNYTSKFARPDDWDEVMKKSLLNRQAELQYARNASNKQYKKMKESGRQKEYYDKWKADNKRRNKEYTEKHGTSYQQYIRRFKKEHNGLSPYQWNRKYQELKEEAKKYAL